MSVVLLAIDTSAGTSVAVVKDGKVLSEHSTEDAMRHAEVIGGFITSSLKDAGVKASDVTHVVAGMGPGPFTGLRVGIAAAEAFAFGAGIPLLPMVSHDAVAWKHFHEESAPVQVVTDARRKEKFWSVYSGMKNNLLIRSEGPALAKADELIHHVECVVEAHEISAGALGHAATHMLIEGIEFLPTEAIYLRSPDVTLSNGPKRVVQK